MKAYKIARIIVAVIVLVVLIYANLIKTDVTLDDVVYTTRTGHCFHDSNCHVLYSQFKTTIRQAREDGYTQCGLCNPWSDAVWGRIFWYACIGFFAYCILGIPVWIKTRKERIAAEAERKRKAAEFSETYNLKDAWSVLGMPSQYFIDYDLIPKLADSADEAIAVYAGSHTYHVKGCRYAIPTLRMSVFEAKYRGMRPCKICCPPQADASWYKKYKALSHEASELGLYLDVIDGIICIKDKKKAV